MPERFQSEKVGGRPEEGVRHLQWRLRKHLDLGAYTLEWLFLSRLLSSAIGSVCAWFLIAL